MSEKLVTAGELTPNKNTGSQVDRPIATPVRVKREIDVQDKPADKQLVLCMVIATRKQSNRTETAGVPTVW